MSKASDLLQRISNLKRVTVPPVGPKITTAGFKEAVQEQLRAENIDTQLTTNSKVDESVEIDMPGFKLPGIATPKNTSGFSHKIDGVNTSRPISEQATKPEIDSSASSTVVPPDTSEDSVDIIKKQIFYDTEFIETKGALDIISIGMVDHEGNPFYAVSNEFNEENASDWVKENVISKLGDTKRISNKEIAEGVLEFIGKDPVDLWAYYSAYDHVVLMWLYGIMVDKPEQLPMLTMDLKVHLLQRNMKSIPAPDGEHDALVDANWNLKLWNHLGRPMLHDAYDVKIKENYDTSVDLSKPLFEDIPNSKVDESIQIDMSAFKMPGM